MTLPSQQPNPHLFVYCIVNIKHLMEFLYLICYACLRLLFLDVETNPGPWRPVPAVCRILSKVSLLWPGSSQWRIYYHRMWGQLSITCNNRLKWPKGELLVAVDHNHLRTMASETADPIDWSHPHPCGQYPHSVSYIVLIGEVSATAGIDLATVQPSAGEATTLPMRPLMVSTSMAAM